MSAIHGISSVLDADLGGRGPDEPLSPPFDRRVREFGNTLLPAITRASLAVGRVLLNQVVNQLELMFKVTFLGGTFCDFRDVWGNSCFRRLDIMVV